MILTYDDPVNDICLHHPRGRDSAPHSECQAIARNSLNPSWEEVDWAWCRATPQRKNNPAPSSDASKFVNWNSGYPQGVLVGRKGRHMLFCRHYLNQVSPSELDLVRFVKYGGVQDVEVEAIVWNAHHDTSIVRLVERPYLAEPYPVCDMRACSPGRKVWLRTCQGQSLPMQVSGIGLDNGSATVFALQDLPDSLNRIVGVHSGDSGTPVLTRLKDGRTAYCGMMWGPGCISFGMPNRLQGGHDPNDWGKSSPHAAGWPRLREVLAEIGDELEIAYPDFDVSDVNSDGIVDGKDLALMLGRWGKSAVDIDIDGDGVAGQAELARILSSWGRAIPPI